jgi:hypothetical protein
VKTVGPRGDGEIDAIQQPERQPVGIVGRRVGQDPRVGGGGRRADLGRRDRQRPVEADRRPATLVDGHPQARALGHDGMLDRELVDDVAGRGAASAAVEVEGRPGRRPGDVPGRDHVASAVGQDDAVPGSPGELVDRDPGPLDRREPNIGPAIEADPAHRGRSWRNQSGHRISSAARRSLPTVSGLLPPRTSSAPIAAVTRETGGATGRGVEADHGTMSAAAQRGSSSAAPAHGRRPSGVRQRALRGVVDGPVWRPGREWPDPGIVGAAGPDESSRAS